jgi:hypothetical protein
MFMAASKNKRVERNCPKMYQSEPKSDMDK